MTITDRMGRTVDGTDSSARPADPNPGLAIKTPCRAATTANITLSGLQTIDGIVLADAERVLVKNQTDATLDGIYNASSGNWTRAKDWDGSHEITRGTQVLVISGTANALRTYSITSVDPLSIGTSAVAITELAPGPELAALAALATTGLMVRAGVSIYTTRTITGTASEITVTNGSGVSGNPTLSLPTALAFSGKTVTGGTFSGITLTASDNALTLQDNGDATKQLQFQLSGISTATTRTLTIPDASGTLALTSSKLSVFAATTSAELAGVISNETGSGVLVFNNGPTLIAPILGTPASGVATNLTGLPLTTGVTGTLPAANGGTGIASYAIGDLLYASGSTALSKLADVATGNALLSGGVTTAPLWGKVGLTTHISGILPAANGGFAADVSAASGVPLFAAGVATFTSTSGTGNFARVTSPTFVTPTLGAATATSINGNTLTAGTFTLTGGAAKTLTFNNSLTLAGTDATTMTFPATSATLARTDAGQTFTGHQTIEGVTSTGATGTGKLVFDGTPTLVTPVLGAATATSINKVAITAPASSATLTIPDGVTLTGPASSGTVMTLGNTETVTGVKTFGSAGAVGRLKIAGTTSGTITLDATATAGSNTLTLPAATDTLVGKATADTLTNKTFDTAGTGNSFSINGVAANANTGTGAVARATSPTFVTPTLGVATATSIDAAAAAGYKLGGVTAILGDATYVYITDRSGVSRMFFGNGGDTTNYYDNAVHYFRSEAQAYRVQIASAGIYPTTDNVLKCGDASNRWTTVYATTGTINTSDAEEKCILDVPDDAVFEAVLAVPQTFFQWNEAVEKKGENARLHYGPTAQAVRDAFTARGLDPTRYALFCIDPLMENEFYEEGGVKRVRQVDTGKTRLGLRLDQFDRLRTEAVQRQIMKVAA